MIYLLVSFLLFLVAGVTQVLLHRVLLAYKIVTFRTLVVFLVGGVAECLLMRNVPLFFPAASCSRSFWCYPLPWSGGAVYVLCSLDWAVMSMSPLLGDESPSSNIIRLLSEHSPRRYHDIRAMFSDQMLIVKRLDDMMRSGWITRLSGHRYRTLSSGERIAAAILWYRRVLGRKDVG